MTVQSDFLSLPGADAIFTVDMSDGARLPVYHLAGPAAGQALLFGHANGFAAGSYEPWLRRLAQALPVFAFDARGHGGSTWPEGPLDRFFAVERIAEDLLRVGEAVAQRAAGHRLAYAGHSLGAASALRLAAAGRLPDWAALILFEPPIFPAPEAKAHAEASRRMPGLVAGTLKRRRDWPSAEAYGARLRQSAGFAAFQDEMLRAHCRATLRPKPDGGVTLCCPPAVESAIYANHWRADNWARLSAVAVPLDLVGGDPATPDNDWISSALPEMAARLPKARLTMVPGTGHMLIFEAPERCAGLVLERLGVRG